MDLDSDNEDTNDAVTKQKKATEKFMALLKPIKDAALAFDVDVDEALEDAERTGRGTHVFLDELEGRIYGLCDGGSSAADIASSILDELDEDASDEVTREDVYLRLARLWRRTLIRLML